MNTDKIISLRDVTMSFYEQARTNMVQNQVMTNQVFDERILNAMQSIPRHLFVADECQEISYSDASINVGEGRKLLAPDVFARMVQALELHSNSKVLDIACGKGYSTLVIAQIAAKVIGLESSKVLSTQAMNLLGKFMKKNLSYKVGDLLAGAPEAAPFDAIMINGVLDTPSQTLLMQLKNGGILITIEQIESISKAVKYQNINNKILKTELFDAYGQPI